MRKTMLYAVVFASILILGSFVVVAKNENAPGQWKKTNEYANQMEFVQALHAKIWERMQARNLLRIEMGKENLINPIGLLKLLNLLAPEEDPEEESEEEDPEEESEEEDPEEESEEESEEEDPEEESEEEEED
jgi:hypothetical protein